VSELSVGLSIRDSEDEVEVQKFELLRALLVLMMPLLLTLARACLAWMGPFACPPAAAARGEHTCWLLLLHLGPTCLAGRRPACSTPWPLKSSTTLWFWAAEGSGLKEVSLMPLVRSSSADSEPASGDSSDTKAGLYDMMLSA